MLRDCFLCGLPQEAIQYGLLSESSLSYKKALEIVRGMEAADKDTKLFEAKDPMIKKIKSRSPEKAASRISYM